MGQPFDKAKTDAALSTLHGALLEAQAAKDDARAAEIERRFDVVYNAAPREYQQSYRGASPGKVTDGPIAQHPTAAGMRSPGPVSPKPPLSQSQPLSYSAGVLGGLASRGGAGIAQGIPPGLMPGDPAEPEDAPKREYASGGPGQEAGNTQRNLDEIVGRGAEYNPKLSMASRAAGTTVRNLPASLLPGGLAAQIATSVPVTAANLSFDAATEGKDPMAAMTEGGWEPYALGAASPLAGALAGRLAKSRMGQTSAAELGDEATRFRIRSTGVSKANADKLYRGKGKAKVDAFARGIEDEGFAGRLIPSRPDQIARRAADAEPKLLAELDAENLAVAEKAPGMKAQDIRSFFVNKADELEGLAAKHGDDILTETARRWRKRADTIQTDVFENRPEAPRIPSRARPRTDSGGSRFNAVTGEYDVAPGNQQPAAFPPLPRGTQSRSPTSGTKPFVHEAEDLAHPGIMKPDPQYDDTLQIPISQGAINKSWMDLLEMRRYWDKAAKKAYEGQDATAAREAREVATFLRRSMADMADALPGDAGKRIREANRRYELTAIEEGFAADQQYAITPSDTLGRDAARGAAAAGPAGAVAAVAATESKGRYPDFQARRLRAAEKRLTQGYVDPGSSIRQVTRAAGAAPIPSAAATADAIRRDIARRQAQENQP